MNIASEKFNNIENIDEINKKKLKENSNEDSTKKLDLDTYLDNINSSEQNDRLNRINEIKRQIQNNTYRIDSTDLAKKIIEHSKGGALIES